MINMRTTIVFLIFVATFSINDGDNFIDRIVQDANFLYTLAAAFGISMMLSGRSLHLMFAVWVLGLTANLPAEFPLNLGIDRDLFGVFMISTLLVPILSRHID